MFEFLESILNYLFGLSSYINAVISGVWGNSWFGFYSIKIAQNSTERIYCILLLAFITISVDVSLHLICRYFGNTIIRKIFGQFSKEKLEKTEYYIQKYGYYCILAYRFIPFFRMLFLFTTCSFFKLRKFIIYNILGAILWIGILYLIYLVEPWRFFTMIYNLFT